MCTLRNFPHLTDHCIEWARDQFELLFSKLGKSLESYIGAREHFETQITDKAASEPGAAFFDLRSLISFSRLKKSPSIGAAAQTAFDLFHFLFRDRILDLQSAFPKDFRIIDAKTKEDKGSFWGEKKRYPTVAVFNPDDSAHIDFLQSTTCLLAVVVGLVPQKQENNDEWLKDYRHK
jgi:ubiquitin-activating enzyme E1